MITCKEILDALVDQWVCSNLSLASLENDLSTGPVSMATDKRISISKFCKCYYVKSCSCCEYFGSEVE